MAVASRAVASPLEQLQTHEERIEKSLESAHDSLRIIHDEQLYKADGYSSFQQYCEQRWDYSKTHGLRLVNHSKFVDHLKSQGVEILPTSEAQTRSINKLRRKCKTDEEFFEKASEAWQVAVDTAPRRQDVPQVTSQHVESAMSRFGISRAVKKPDDVEIQEFIAALVALGRRRLMTKMTGREFVKKYGPKLRDKHRPLIDWLVDYDEAAMDAADD